MKNLKFLDAVVGLVALLFATQFVDGSHQLMKLLGMDGLPLSISYGLLLVVSSSGFSLARKIAARPSPEQKFEWRRVGLGAATLVVGIMMFASVGLGVSKVNSNEVVSPYLSYLVSVLFCMGIGYIFADLLVAFFNLFRRKL